MGRPRDSSQAKKARGTYRKDRDPELAAGAAVAPSKPRPRWTGAALPATPQEWRALICSLPKFDPYLLAGECLFDEARAAKAIRWIETHVRHTKGEKACMPFLLEPWQRAVVANMFGWVFPVGHARAGLRRFSECLIYVAKKAGKSALVMALTLYLFLEDDEPGAEVYCAAAKRDQARIIWDQCRGQLARIDPEEERATRYLHSITKPDGGFLKPISADAGLEDGMNPSAAIIDELHRQPNDKLINMILLSTDARRQPVVIYLTTADEPGEDRVCNQVLDRAKAVLANLGDPLTDGYEPDFLPVIYEADEADDWTLEATWRKANPSLGVTIAVEKIAKRCRNAKSSPSLLAAFKRYCLNLQVQSLEAPIRAEVWKARRGERDWLQLREDMKGRPCILGGDLAECSDMVAVDLWFYEDGVICPWFWATAAAAEERRRKNPNLDLYHRWAEVGALELASDNAIELGPIVDKVGALSKLYVIRFAGIDKYKAQEFTWAAQKLGLEAMYVEQGWKTMTEPCDRLIANLENARVVHGGHPVLTWNAANLRFKVTDERAKKPMKASKPRKIDGMSAWLTAMAVESAKRGDLGPKSGPLAAFVPMGRGGDEDDE